MPVSLRLKCSNLRCGHATESLKDGMLVTVSCSEGDTGFIYDGLLETEVTEVQRGAMPEIDVSQSTAWLGPGTS